MSLSVLQVVALELGFPKSIVRRALRKYSFYSAGDFVDYLETHDYEFEVESEDEKEEAIPVENNITIIAPPATKNLNKEEKAKPSLREETETLQSQSLCLVCRKEKRSFVCLPCSHFVICRMCEPSTRHCPRRSCGEYISCTIQTYGLWLILGARPIRGRDFVLLLINSQPQLNNFIRKWNPVNEGELSPTLLNHGKRNDDKDESLLSLNLLPRFAFSLTKASSPSLTRMISRSPKLTNTR